MAQPRPAPWQAFFRWLAVETRGSIFGFFGGVIAALFAFALLNYHYKGAGAVQGDPVAIANTYIVFTTFIVTAVAVVLAVAGLIFTQHFSMEKEAHVDHAFAALVQQITNGEGKAIAFTNELMNNPEVVQHVRKMLDAKLDEQILSRFVAAEKTASNAKAEADQLASLRARISPTPTE
jgi:hypothetical protein